VSETCRRFPPRIVYYLFVVVYKGFRCVERYLVSNCYASQLWDGGRVYIVDVLLMFGGVGVICRPEEGERFIYYGARCLYYLLNIFRM
jgi:hypothetical protein